MQHFPISIFQSLPESTKRELESDRDLLAKVIKYHIVPDQVYSTDLNNDIDIPTKDSQKKITVKEYSSVSF